MLQEFMYEIKWSQSPVQIHNKQTLGNPGVMFAVHLTGVILQSNRDVSWPHWIFRWKLK
jgi:hypothetical protein